MDDLTKRLISQVEARTKNLTEIYDEVKDDDKCFDQLELVKDSFEVSDELIDCIDKSDKYNPKFFEKLKCAIIRSISEDLPVDVIKNKYGRQPMCILDYLLDNLNVINFVPDELDDESDVEDNNEINDDIAQHVDNWSWRKHQTEAIHAIIRQAYKCGIVHHIMGAGKTIIMLSIIYEHLKKYGGKSTYIVACDRQEVLSKMFFDGIVLDQNKVDFWKNKKIIDIDLFNVIDCINNKPGKITCDPYRPNILVINNDYLQSMEKKGEIEWDNVAFVELDECHCVSGEMFYKLLREIKYTYNKSIIGFSATPLREKADRKLKDIFSECTDDAVPINQKKVNLISQYDLMMAISDEVILPFTCEYVQIKRTKKDCIGVKNPQIIQKIFDDILPKLPYKKLVMWCKTKTHMMDYYNFFRARYEPKFTVFCTSSFDAELTKKGYNTNLDEFYKKTNNAILFCINKMREGSDIRHLDAGMFLDGVRRRSTLVSMQTGGRVARPDEEGKKTRAYLVDTFICDTNQTVELFTVNKVIAYYQKLLNLAEDEYENYGDYYDNMLKIAAKTVIDEKTNTIYIKVDDDNKHDIQLKIKMQTRQIDWGTLKQLIKTEIDSKFRIDKTTQFNHIMKTLKDMKEFDINCEDFWKTYRRIPKDVKEQKFLPVDLYEEFKEIFDKTTWYELLGLDTSMWYQNKTKCATMVRKLLPNGKLTVSIYAKLCNKDKRLPPNPAELYKKANFTTIENEFNVVGINMFA